MNPEKLQLFDFSGETVAELEICEQSDGWYSGRLLFRVFSPSLQSALDRYDEIVENQIISLMDDALAELEAFGLKAQFPNGTLRQIYSLHISPDDSGFIRIMRIL